MKFEIRDGVRHEYPERARPLSAQEIREHGAGEWPKPRAKTISDAKVTAEPAVKS